MPPATPSLGDREILRRPKELHLPWDCDYRMGSKGGQKITRSADDIRNSESPPNHERKLVLRLPRCAFSYLRFILEGYDGIAQMSALPGRSEVELIVPAGRERELGELLDAVHRELVERGQEALWLLGPKDF